MLLNRLTTLAAEGSWFSDAQHGFRRGKSTESAALSLTSFVESNHKKKLVTTCAFLDIKSAFDTVWRPAIIKSLLDCNCPLYLVRIIESFLSGRSAILSGYGLSIVAELQLGCPQGSALSPFLWNILVDAVLRIKFPFLNRIIAYADDLVLISSHCLLSQAVINLQAMCDTVIEWGSQVKLTFNAGKTAFLIFSKKRQIPVHTLVINNVIIHRSRSTTYLGLIIDDKLNWRQHIVNKCTKAKKLSYLVLKCARLTWGLSMSKLQLLYKTVVLPSILYCSNVWIKSTLRKTVVKELRKAQRPFAISIARVFKTTSTEAALVLANTLPIELKARETLIKRSLSPMVDYIPSSTLSLVSNIRDNVITAIPPTGKSLSSFRKQLITTHISEKWDAAWAASTKGAITRQFFPLTSAAKFLSKINPSYRIMQLLSGCTILNDYLFKIKRSKKPHCSCDNLSPETVEHYLFVCPILSASRNALIKAVEDAGLQWPPKFSDLVSAQLWSALNAFVVGSNRLTLSRERQEMDGPL